MIGRQILGMSVVFLLFSLSLQAENFKEPGLYVIKNFQKGCVIEKWDPSYAESKRSESIVQDDYFLRKMGGASKNITRPKTRSIGGPDQFTAEEVENALGDLLYNKEAEVDSLFTLTGLFGYNTRQELSNNCLKILLSDLRKISAKCKTKDELIAAMKVYFHAEGLGSNAYIPQQINDAYFEKRLSKYGKGIKLFTALKPSEAAIFKKSFQRFFKN